MKYYFNSLEQIKGDKAYSEQNFDMALIFYKQGLQMLKQIAAQETFKADFDFNDELGYLICDIIITKVEIIFLFLDKVNYNEIKLLWKEIPTLLTQLETVYQEILFYRQRQTTAKKVTSVYETLADICEQIGSKFIGSIDESDPIISNMRKIKSAMQWLEQSIHYCKVANLSIKIKIHLTYLSILEKKYTFEKNKLLLIELNEYIQNNNLYSLKLSPKQRLRVLSYQLFAAIENNVKDTAVFLATKCRKIIEESTHIAQDSLLVQEINKLIAKLPSLSQEDLPPLASKRKFIFDTPMPADTETQRTIAAEEPASTTKGEALPTLQKESNSAPSSAPSIRSYASSSMIFFPPIPQTPQGTTLPMMHSAV